MRIPLVVQYRHVHLSQQDFSVLFGTVSGKQIADIGHFGQFVTDLTVDVIGETGIIRAVRVLGPARDQTQVELCASDVAAIGLRAPVRLSGDLSRSAGCTLEGPAGKIRVVGCVIIPARHLHLNSHSAEVFGLKHGQTIAVRTDDDHAVRIEHIVVRVHPTFANEFHVTADEAAEHWLNTGQCVRVCE